MHLLYAVTAAEVSTSSSRVPSSTLDFQTWTVSFPSSPRKDDLRYCSRRALSPPVRRHRSDGLLLFPQVLNSVSTAELSELLNSSRTLTNGSGLCDLLQLYNQTMLYMETVKAWWQRCMIFQASFSSDFRNKLGMGFFEKKKWCSSVNKVCHPKNVSYLAKQFYSILKR